jgi:hypothetical protein
MSDDLKATINHLELLSYELSEKQYSLQQEEKRKQLLLDEIRKRIHGGESTGDRFRDFVILQLGYDLPAAAETYLSVDKRIAKNQGQPILMIERWVEHIDSLPAFDYSSTRVGGCFHEVVRLGILKSIAFLEFDYQTLQITFPTGEYAEGQNVIKDHMQLMYSPNTHLHESLTKIVTTPYGRSALALSLYIGCDEINQAAEENLIKAYHLSQVLGHPLPMSEKLDSALVPQRSGAMAELVTFLEKQKKVEQELETERSQVRAALEAVGLNFEEIVEAIVRK